MEQELQIVSAFTLDGRGGNPAAVVLNADGLSEGAMQSIAAQTGLSETAFLSHSNIATYKLDFFTPRRRIAHCGHATVAAFGLLESNGILPAGAFSKETVDGLRTIVIDRGYAGMQQRPPTYRSVDAEEVLSAIGISMGNIDSRFPPMIVNTGNSFVLVGLRDEQVLAALSPDFAAIERISEQHDLIGFYPFVAGVRGFDAVSRMFAPRYGISEESATGMAAGPLACLLHRAGLVGELSRIEQGAFMAEPSPSLLAIRLTVEKGIIVDVLAGGSVAIVETRRVQYGA